MFHKFTIQSALNVSQNLLDLFGKHTQIWNNHCYKELAIGILVRIGTNMLLNETSFWPVYIAGVIVVLEHYDNSGDIIASINSRVATSKSEILIQMQVVADVMFSSFTVNEHHVNA